MIKFACPECQVKLKSEALGKKIKCPKCSAVIQVPAEDVEQLEEVIPVPERPAESKKNSKVERPAGSKKNSKFERADQVTARPPKVKTKAVAPPPDDDADDSGDEEDEQPRKKKKKKDVNQAMIIGISVASVLVVFVLVVSVVLLSGKKSAHDPPVASNQPGSGFPQQAPVNQLAPAVNAPATGTTPPANVPPVRAKGPEAAYDDWLQNLDEAKKKATDEKKDLLLLFNGSDWSPESMSLTDGIITRPEFSQRAGGMFVLVHIDFPKRPPALARVKNGPVNNQLRVQYGVRLVPTVILADAQGRPYTKTGYVPEPAGAYISRLDGLRQTRLQRDEWIARVDQATGILKTKAASDFVKFIQEKDNELVDFDLLIHYLPLFEEWYTSAITTDKNNEEGVVEYFFELAWANGLRRFRPDRPADIVPHVQRLDEWKKTYKFKDANRAAVMHLLAFRTMVLANKKDEAKRYIQEGQAYTPSDRKLLQALTNASSMFGGGSGTGFVVAPGYVVTNHHVVKGEARTSVRLPKIEGSVTAEIVAQSEELDLAILRVQNPAAAKLQPLCVAGVEAERGETVAAFGFPIATVVGASLKLTTGVISATPDAGNGNMLVIDARINPGNSGGPLCDSCGNVLGIVTLKTKAAAAGATNASIDSYGMAIPAKDVLAFLRKNIKNYQVVTPSKKRLPWNDVDRRVSGSVLMVLKGDESD